MGRTEKRGGRDVKILEEWQRRWTNGRSLFLACPKVGLEPLELLLKGVQMATGHRKLLSYLGRFRLRDVGGMRVREGHGECGAR